MPDPRRRRGIRRRASQHARSHNQRRRGHAMKRRKFLKTAGVGAVPRTASRRRPSRSRCRKLKWRLTSSFPKSLDTLYGGCRDCSPSTSREMTDNKFQIQVFAAGEIVPGAAGRSTRCRTAPSRWATPPPTTTSARIRPSRFVRACRSASTRASRTPGCYYGGGTKLMNEFYKEYNIHRLRRRQHRRQMGGWFRKEIKTSTTSRA